MTGPKLSGCMALFLFLVEYTAANCALKLDLVFIIDGTSTVPPHDFSKLKQAVLALLRCMHERDQVHAGVVVYGSTLAKPIPLSGDREKLVELEKVSPPMGQPQTHIALLNGRSLFRKRGRPQVKKVLVFLTSGLGTFVQETVYQAERAREEGYRLIVVTLSNNVEGADQLPWRPEDLFKLKNTNEMVEELGKIARKICSVAHAEPIKPLVRQSSTSSFTRKLTDEQKGTSQAKKQPMKDIGEIAAALRGKPDVDEPDACSKSIMVQGVGYVRHPTECQKFIQCFLKQNGAWYHVIQSCDIGEFWDHDLLACRIAEVVDCLNDRCKDMSVTALPHSDNCRAFYNCEKGRSVGQCCPDGSSFESERGCVNHTTCSQDCVPKERPKPGLCDRAAVFGRPEVYSQFVSSGSFWIEMLCANGSWYNDRKCGCSEKIMKPWDTDSDGANMVCKPEVYLPFCGGILDHSGHGNVVENEGDRVFVIDGKAYFNGHSTLYLPSFSNAHYGDSVVIKLKYKMANSVADSDHSDEYNDFGYYNADDDSFDFNDDYDEEEDDSLYNTMALVSNGDCDNDYTWSGSCYENPTITIATNRRSTIFDVHMSEAEHETQLVVHKKVHEKSHDDLDVDYYDDEYYSYLFENEFHDDSNNCTNDTWDDEWRTVMFLVHNSSFTVYDNSLHEQIPVSGYVRTTAAGLQFGQGSGFRNFKGYMDEIYVYLCRPKDNVLFNDDDMAAYVSTHTDEETMEKTTEYEVPDVTTQRASSKTLFETTEVGTSIASDVTSGSTITSDSATTQLDHAYLTRIITEALNSELSTATSNLSEVTSLGEHESTFRNSVISQSVTTVSDMETTLNHIASTFNLTSSSSLLMETTSSPITATSSDSLIASPSVLIDTTQSVIEDTEKITDASSISSYSSQTTFQTTFEAIGKGHTTGSEFSSSDGGIQNDVTSVSNILEGSNLQNNSILYNSTTQSLEEKNVDDLIFLNTSTRNIILKNNSLISIIKSKNIYLNSTKYVSSLDLENDSLQLVNHSENNRNHCCIDSQIHGASKEHNQSAQRILKTIGAIVHNENDKSIEKESITENSIITTVIQTIHDTTLRDTTSPRDVVTNSNKFSKWLFAKFDSDYHSKNRQDEQEQVSDTNITTWRP